MNNVLKVSVVEDDSQAEKLGIKPDDIIVFYNETAISTNTAFLNAAYAAKENGPQNVEIVIDRQGDILRFNASPQPLGLKCKEVAAPVRKLRSAAVRKNSTEYGVAHGVSLAVSFVGWALVLLGVIVAVIAVAGALKSHGFSLVAVLPGLGTVVSGLFLIMGAQVTIATVDTADYTREILEVVNNNK